MRLLFSFAVGVVLMPAGLAVVTAEQLLPPPVDGDIRVVHWDLQNRSQVWLTLEPKAPDGTPAPLLTLAWDFAGKRPVSPPTQIELRAYAGVFWAPRVELWLALDDEARFDLVAGPVFGLVSGVGSDYLPAAVSIETLQRIADARRVAGNALGFPFELSDAQRLAVRAFLERVTGGQPRD